MLTVSQVSKSFGGRTLFEDASLQVNRGERIGLVGPNGAGKSTLFSLILKDATPDEGRLSIERGATIGYLRQETAPAGDETVLSLATAVTPELGRAREIIQRHEAHTGETSPEEEEAYHEALGIFAEASGYQLEAQAKRILKGLAFRESDFDRPARTLSGGWIMRAHLAKLLVAEPDLLLLDEPTNHLDLESLVWFQEHLRGYRGAIVVISHDREFLNQLVDSILESRAAGSSAIAATGTIISAKKPRARSSTFPPTRTSSARSRRCRSSPIASGPRRARPPRPRAS